ncbi:predicted protein, partial [Nematostella vectensis]
LVTSKMADETLPEIDEAEFYRSLLLEQAMKTHQEEDKDFIEFFPDHGFVFKSKVTADAGVKKVFVNICTSEHIPKAKDISEQELAEILDSEDPMRYRVPLSLGEPHAEMDKSGNGCTVYDIVINPTFLKKVQENTFFKNFFLTVVFQGLEEKYGLDLDRSWSILKNKKYMGKPQMHYVRKKSKPVIMDLTNSADKEESSKSTSQLISTLEPSIPQPMYNILTEPSDDKPEFIVLEISLPGLKSIKDTALDVGEDRLLLHVDPNRYHLDLDLPHNVDVETCGAQFNKKTKV